MTNEYQSGIAGAGDEENAGLRLSENDRSGKASRGKNYGGRKL